MSKTKNLKNNPNTFTLSFIHTRIVIMNHELQDRILLQVWVNI